MFAMQNARVGFATSRPAVPVYGLGMINAIPGTIPKAARASLIDIQICSSLRDMIQWRERSENRNRNWQIFRPRTSADAALLQRGPVRRRTAGIRNGEELA